MNSFEKSKQATDSIWNRIYFIRGERVMLDFDLAILYRVTTKRLNEQLRRNIERFPTDVTVANCDLK